MKLDAYKKCANNQISRAIYDASKRLPPGISFYSVNFSYLGMRPNSQLFPIRSLKTQTPTGYLVAYLIRRGYDPLKYFKYGIVFPHRCTYKDARVRIRTAIREFDLKAKEINLSENEGNIDLGKGEESYAN